MEDEYKEDDAVNREATGIWAVIDYFRANVLRPSFRGFLFGVGHFLTYRVLGDLFRRNYLSASR